jgi:hypothetical protein
MSAGTTVDRTPVRRDFLDLARLGRPGAWRWILGVVTILFFWMILGAVQALAGGGNPGDTGYLPYIALNLSFVAMLLGLWIAVRVIHRRPFLTLATPLRRLRPKLLALGFGAMLVGVTVATAAEYLVARPEVSFQFNAGRYLMFLPVVLVLTSIQTTAEELLFRGYLLQGTALWTRNVVVLAMLNGVLFGVPHFLNPELRAGFVLVALYYVAFGALAAALAIRAGALELVIGVHAANNLFSALIYGYATSALSTEPLLVQKAIDPRWTLPGLAVTALVFVIICRRRLTGAHARATTHHAELKHG